MNQLSRFVSLHPYFKVPSDKMPYLKAILPEFAAKTRNETGNLFYEFTINGDEVFCREGYVNAEALLAHLENVGAMLAQALAMADLIRIEVHGPAAELAKLKEPLAHLKPAWFRIAQLIAMVAPIILNHRFGVLVETVRGQREHARKCSCAHCNHQQQAQNQTPIPIFVLPK